MFHHDVLKNSRFTVMFGSSFAFIVMTTYKFVGQA